MSAHNPAASTDEGLSEFAQFFQKPAAKKSPAVAKPQVKIGRGELILRWALGILALGAAAVALQPDLRNATRNFAASDSRSVLSTAHGRLLGDATDFTVAKVKTRDSLFLEIYQSLSEGERKLVERIELPDRRDGYFSFNGRATNLAIQDIDGDGRLAILAPTFDNDLVGRLNVFRYDPASHDFHRSSIQ